MGTFFLLLGVEFYTASHSTQSNTGLIAITSKEGLGNALFLVGAIEVGAGILYYLIIRRIRLRDSLPAEEQAMAKT